MIKKIVIFRLVEKKINIFRLYWKLLQLNNATNISYDGDEVLILAPFGKILLIKKQKREKMKKLKPIKNRTDFNLEKQKQIKNRTDSKSPD